MSIDHCLLPPVTDKRACDRRHLERAREVIRQGTRWLQAIGVANWCVCSLHYTLIRKCHNHNISLTLDSEAHIQLRSQLARDVAPDSASPVEPRPARDNCEDSWKQRGLSKLLFSSRFRTSSLIDTPCPLLESRNASCEFRSQPAWRFVQAAWGFYLIDPSPTKGICARTSLEFFSCIGDALHGCYQCTRI